MFGDGEGKINLDTCTAEALRTFLKERGVLSAKENADAHVADVTDQAPAGVPVAGQVPEGTVLRAKKVRTNPPNTAPPVNAAPAT